LSQGPVPSVTGRAGDRAPEDPLHHDLPHGIGRPATRALTLAGLTRLDQFTTVREAELLRLHGVGPKAVGVIRRALAERGLTFLA
jgi:hypothetical protein